MRFAGFGDGHVLVLNVAWCVVLSCFFKQTQTLCLGQYREAFLDAAIDGSFLYDLNEDDLKNSLGKLSHSASTLTQDTEGTNPQIEKVRHQLTSHFTGALLLLPPSRSSVAVPGIEHRLHRKKILTSIYKLKNAEADRERQYLLKQISKEQLVGPMMGTGAPTAAGGLVGSTTLPMNLTTPLMSPAITTGIGGVGAATLPLSSGIIALTPVGTGEVAQPNAAPRLDLAELISWVRHSKNGKIKVCL